MTSERIYRHIKSGTLYEKLMDANLEANQAPMVVYRSQTTGAVWIRSLDEFESKFELVSSQALTDAKINEIFHEAFKEWGHEGSKFLLVNFARAVERACGIKREETVPWPTIDGYAGSASKDGLYGYLMINIDGKLVKYVPEKT